MNERTLADVLEAEGGAMVCILDCVLCGRQTRSTNPEYYPLACSPGLGHVCHVCAPVEKGIVARGLVLDVTRCSTTDGTLTTVTLKPTRGTVESSELELGAEDLAYLLVEASRWLELWCRTITYQGVGVLRMGNQAHVYR